MVVDARQFVQSRNQQTVSTPKPDTEITTAPSEPTQESDKILTLRQQAEEAQREADRLNSGRSFALRS
jgi:hypothetical protein